MDLRGQRFTLDLSDDEDETGSSSRIPSNASPSIPGAFIGDIQERTSSTPPTAPKLKTTTSGFPEHRKRTKVSAFKQQRGGASAKTATDIPTPSKQDNKDDLSFEEQDRRRIDEENRQKIESMSAEEIEEERAELLAALNPSLIERLLKRANLDDGRGDTGTELPSKRAESVAPSKPIEQFLKQANLDDGRGDTGTELPSERAARELAAKTEVSAAKEPVNDETEEQQSKPTKETKETMGGVPVRKPLGKPVTAQKGVRFEDDDAPAEPIDLHPISSLPTTHTPSIHWPEPPPAPALDPSDPSFFTTLHETYFPSLPSDPSKLAWMSPLPTQGSPADQDSPYYPAQPSIPSSAIRFGFKGGMLPPRIARAVPVTKGLHHHGEAPEAAGYTIPELARLARSAFPAQRCMAFQTLGRILYRMGRGSFGAPDGDLVRGLWKSVEEGKVLGTLEEAANAEGGHQGCKSHAVTALWLWHKGGGKVWSAS